MTMKNIFICIALLPLAVPAAAQESAMSQLSAGTAVQAEAPEASAPKAVQLVLNPGNSLTGKWTGWGEWTYQGSGTRCTMMTLTFDDGKDYLDRKGGYFDCGFVALESEPGRWTKKDGLLFDANGAEAGSYAAGTVVLKEAYSENVDILTTIKVDGLHFDYSEIWTEKNGRELYVITGRLFTGG